MQRSTWSVLLLALLCWGPLAVHAAKFLFIPFPWKSIIHQFKIIGEDLLSRKHEVSILLPPTYPGIQDVRGWTGFDVVEYAVAEPDFYTLIGSQEDKTEEFLYDLYQVPMKDTYPGFMTEEAGMIQLCSNPLKDQNLFKTLQKKQFDLALVHGQPEYRCLLILCQKLDLPYTTFVTFYEPWVTRNPALPSFSPLMFGRAYSPDMSFGERVDNVLSFLQWNAFTQIPTLSDNFVRQYLPSDKPFMALDEMAHRSVLWFRDTDILLDFPGPKMPNEIDVGGLTTQPAKPLPDDIKTFLDTSEEGVIVVSFGSQMALSSAHNRIFMQTFLGLKERVIWRYTDPEKPTDIPDRIKLMDWLPQNDILGHTNVKLFVGHCGLNGMFEALYHGVPMLGFPMVSDQPYRGKQLVYHGFGETVDLMTVTPDVLAEAIHKVINNESYRRQVQRASQIFRSRPMTPKETTVFWLEHVVRFGGKHLHSYALDIPWYQYVMLDLVLVLVAVLGVVVMMFYCVLAFFWLKCKRHTKAKRE